MAGFYYIKLTVTKGRTEYVFPTFNFSELIGIKNKLEDAELIPFTMNGHCKLMHMEQIDNFVLNMKLMAFFDCGTIVSSIDEAYLKDKTFLSAKKLWQIS